MSKYYLLSLLFAVPWSSQLPAQQTSKADLFLVPEISSSWDDLTDGLNTMEDWATRKIQLRQQYLELLRDEYKPQKPALDLRIHEEVVVEGIYTRQLISYAVEGNERAHAYLGIPLHLESEAPAIVALHGTYEFGKMRAAGLIDNPDKAYLDHLCRRGYVVIAPEHFVSGHRTPEEGPYETATFYEKHPNWTAVGKFTFEHSIAVDVLETLDHVDKERIGALGHSLGGHGTFFLAAYDERIKASASNCSAAFFRHNHKVEAWARDHWYIYFKHLREGLLNDEMPAIDFHQIMALIAPRAFLDLSGLNDGDDLTQRQRVLMMMKLMDIYELEEAPQNFAFYVHGRGHSVAHESRQLMYGWMDTHLKPPKSVATKLVGSKKDPLDNLSFKDRLDQVSEDNIFMDPDYFNWGSSIIKGNDGVYHLFYSRWQEDFSAWLTFSEIAHATSDSPNGPWQYKETILRGRGKGYWDAITAHNPKIKYFDGKYYLYYIATNLGDMSYTEQDLIDTHGKSLSESPMRKVLRENQRTGVAVSNSINGPWKRLDKPIIEPSGPITTLTVNPAIAKGVDGKYYLIVKGDKPNEERFIRNQAIATSESPIGPFEMHSNPVIDDLDTEDMSLWYDAKRKCFFGIFHAHEFIGLVTSTDGVQWKKAANMEVLRKEIPKKNGEIIKPDRMERPFVYIENGEPKTLCLAVKKGDKSYTVFVPIKAAK